MPKRIREDGDLKATIEKSNGKVVYEDGERKEIPLFSVELYHQGKELRFTSFDDLDDVEKVVEYWMDNGENTPDWDEILKSSNIM